MSDREYPSGIHSPDWDRVNVHSAANLKPVGDPTRWGSSNLSPIFVAPPVAGELSSAGAQIIQVSTQDPYARAWALNGTLSLPDTLWGISATVPVVSIVSLQVQMGVGQAQVLHEILLFRGVAGLSAVPNSGLCWTQDSDQGGPYLHYETPSLEVAPTPGAVDLTYAFSIIGGLVGHSINIRSKYVFGNVAAPMPEFPFRSLINVVLTPFAAGEGL